MTTITANKSAVSNSTDTYPFKPYDIMEFHNKQHGPVFQLNIELEFNLPTIDMLSNIVNMIEEDINLLKSYGTTSYILASEDKFLDISVYDTQKPLENELRKMLIRISANKEVAEMVYKRLEKYRTHNTSAPIIYWYYLDSSGRMVTTSIEVSPCPNVYDEFYPWIQGGIKSYLDDFVNDDANIMVLLGEPGTGKTTFINHFIHEYVRKPSLTFSSEVMIKDEFFINFLNGNQDLLIMEDADLLLKSRVDNNNIIMSKLLNSSDGLVKIRKKKIIFTANITDTDDIDTALIRPGRCFDLLQFRRLSHDEIADVVKVAGLNPITSTKELTLAEIFKSHRSKVNVRQRQSAGFLRHINRG